MERGPSVISGSDPIHPAQRVGGSLPLHNNDSLGPVRRKGGRIKKASKKPYPYPPGNKFANLQEMCKGTRKLSRKKGVNGAQCAQLSCSMESDPIETCGKEVSMVQQHQICDFDGIGLEVVLSRPAEAGVGSSGSEVQCSVEGGNRGNCSGLGDLIGEPIPISSSVQAVNGGLVDKEKGDAFHVIDIQEDISMNFNGVGEEDVIRCMTLEGRDRQNKLEWVQGHSYQ
jgi:hypothetical protein